MYCFSSWISHAIYEIVLLIKLHEHISENVKCVELHFDYEHNNVVTVFQIYSIYLKKR